MGSGARGTKFGLCAPRLCGRFTTRHKTDLACCRKAHAEHKRLRQLHLLAHLALARRRTGPEIETRRVAQHMISNVAATHGQRFQDSSHVRVVVAAEVLHQNVCKGRAEQHLIREEFEPGSTRRLMATRSQAASTSGCGPVISLCGFR